MKSLLRLILLITLLPAVAAAQPDMIVEHYTKESGLPSNTVYCAQKDGDGGKDEILASSALAKADKDIRLKIVSRGLTFDFYYAVGKGEWKLLKNNVDAGFLSTRNAGGFTGTTIGLYATRG